jgi:ABC-type cobalt transport system substrate-binding protein
MKLIKWTEILVMTLALGFGLSFGTFSGADESATETVKEEARDVKKNSKQAWRNTKDEACEMVNGKMECAGKKIKHKAQNAGDELKDKTDTDTDTN